MGGFTDEGPSYLYCDICGYFHPDECEGFFGPDDDVDPVVHDEDHLFKHERERDWRTA